MIRLSQMPSGVAFVGSTPERLFTRCGAWVASEAVAGTRSRHPVEERDAQLAYDMLLNTKENDEFTIVRESVFNELQSVCEGPVRLEMEKAVLKQVR
jgi:isochorismate synthase EntC